MTKTSVACHAGMATDAGLLRSNNEDRAFVDEHAGIFLVVDGMGGHAAGEKAAETAASVIPAQIETLTGSVEDRIRNAIASANNEIFQLGHSHQEWAGMACVLTCAVAYDDRLTVGHVGDSRLYLAFNGSLRKLTSDHSPVGEREDRGDLTEAEAMQDPRRNQVFRDVGSHPHEPFDDEFIEIKTVPFRPDAAFLICSDGLSDVLTNAQMNAIVERYAGDPHHTAQELVDAANQAGGKDNITVIFIAGPEFKGPDARAIADARARHSITRMKTFQGPWRVALSRILWLAAGAALGIAGLISSEKFIPRSEPDTPTVHAGARHILADPANPHSLSTALAAAHSGDVIEVPKGEYLGPVELREGVDVISVSPGESIITADDHAPIDPGIGIAAHNIKSARLSGFRVVASAASPLTTGLWIDNSNLEVNELDVTGASHCGVHFTGNSAGVLRASSLQGPSSCGILVEGQSSPRLIGNHVTAADIVIQPPARPVLLDNVIGAPGKQK